MLDIRSSDERASAIFFSPFGDTSRIFASFNTLQGPSTNALQAGTNRGGPDDSSRRALNGARSQKRGPENSKIPVPLLTLPIWKRERNITRKLCENHTKSS